MPFAREGEGRVGGGSEAVGARGELMNEHLGGCIAGGFSMNAGRRQVRCEAEAFELADVVLLDDNAAVLLDLREGSPCRACFS